MTTSHIDLIVRGDHADPFGFLGMHEAETAAAKHIVVRCFIPGADQVWVIDAHQPDSQRQMMKVRDEGFFELAFRRSTRKIPLSAESNQSVR